MMDDGNESGPPGDPGDLPDGGESLAPLVEGDVIEFALQPFLEPMGGLFAVVVIAGVMGILWIWSGDIGLPIVTSILLSGLMVTVLPFQLIGVLEDIIILGIALALFSAWWTRQGRM